MVTIRRWYIFLVAAISLNVVAWAAISLIQDLVTGGSSLLAAAFQIAVIVVGVPVFLVHWLWAERLARAEPSERQATLRQIYLYGMQAGFLAPLLVNVYHLVSDILWAAQTALNLTISVPVNGADLGESAVRAVVAILVLALLWYYHRRVALADLAAEGAEIDHTVRRVYVLGFSTVGYTLTALASIHLLRWIMYQLSAATALGTGPLTELNNAVATLAVGGPVWVIFWSAAQRAFRRPDPEEARSALRKFYLYAIVFNAVLAVVTNLALILAGLIRRLLDLPSAGDLRQPLPIILILAVVWAYHAWVLRADAAAAEAEAPRANGVRRLYLYLVAGVGLAAALVGVGGLIGVLINAVFTQSFRADLAEGFAWFTASLIAGLPVWAWPWRQVQTAAVAGGPAGGEERQSTVRKLYLYFFLLTATLTFLGSAVYIFYTLLASVLGASLDDPLITLTTAVAYCLIAVAVWVYHGGALRGDGRRAQQEQAARMAAFKVAVADVAEAEFGRRLVGALKRELPGLAVEFFNLSANASEVTDVTPAAPRAFELAQADVIVGPWTMATPAAEAGQAIAASPARKLLVPVPVAGWQWVGGDGGSREAQALQAARAVRQLVQGEELRGTRPMGAGTVVAIVLGVIFVLTFVLPLALSLIFSGGF